MYFLDQYIPENLRIIQQGSLFEYFSDYLKCSAVPSDQLAPIAMFWHGIFYKFPNIFVGILPNIFQ